QESEAHRLGHGDYQQRSRIVSGFGDRSEIFNATKEVGRLDYNRRGFVIKPERVWIDSAGFGVTKIVQREPQILRVSGDHFAILRMKRISNDELIAASDSMRHKHSFGGSGRAVVHRGIRDIHAGELADHRLKLEVVLKRAMAEFRLIRRVCRKELRARDQRIDDDRNEMRVSAGAEETLVIDSVLRSESSKILEQFRLAHRRANAERFL